MRENDLRRPLNHRINVVFHTSTGEWRFGGSGTEDDYKIARHPSDGGDDLRKLVDKHNAQTIVNPEEIRETDKKLPPEIQGHQIKPA